MRRNGIFGDMINILGDFTINQKQTFVLNGQGSSLVDIYSHITHGSILWPLLFVIYINNLSVGLKWKCKPFLEDTSLFLLVQYVNISTNDLTIDLQKIYGCAYQRKTEVNCDASKQAQK